MRRFNLTTGNGNVVDLTTETVFFHDVSGIGYSSEGTYRRVGRKYSLLDSKISQGTVSGSIAFLGEKPYDQYFSFVEAATSSGLVLGYTTNETDWYYRDVIVSSIEKSEINELGYLDVSVEFLASTPWYKKVTLCTENATLTGNKGFVWDATWPIGFRSTSGMSVIVDVDSNADSPCRLIIGGKITNPVWKHYVNGILKSTGTLTTEIASDQHLVIDNRGDSYEMKLYNTDMTSVIKDVYQLSDFTTDRFINLQHGRNQISVSSDNTEDVVDIKLEASIYYDTV